MTAHGEPHVALLRGVNVGGANLVRMADLAASFEALGFRSVATYIQSGNVVFQARPSDLRKMAARIEKALLSDLGISTAVILRSRRQMQGVVAHAPSGFGSEPAAYRYDVAFLKEPLAASDALASVPTREGVDAAQAGDGVLYFSRLARRASQSRLSRLASMPVYRSMTIRNWNTTTKLLRLMEEGRPHGAGATGHGAPSSRRRDASGGTAPGR